MDANWVRDSARHPRWPKVLFQVISNTKKNRASVQILPSNGFQQKEEDLSRTSMATITELVKMGPMAPGTGHAVKNRAKPNFTRKPMVITSRRDNTTTVNISSRQQGKNCRMN